jgi:hypothetical protein
MHLLSLWLKANLSYLTNYSFYFFHVDWYRSQIQCWIFVVKIHILNLKEFIISRFNVLLQVTCKHLYHGNWLLSSCLIKIPYSFLSPSPPYYSAVFSAFWGVYFNVFYSPSFSSSPPSIVSSSTHIIGSMFCIYTYDNAWIHIWIWLSHMRENIWPLSFWTWLTTYNLMFSSFIHLPDDDKISFFLIAE